MTRRPLARLAVAMLAVVELVLELRYIELAAVAAEVEG
jgi:hypothetical protein